MALIAALAPYKLWLCVLVVIRFSIGIKIACLFMGSQYIVFFRLTLNHTNNPNPLITLILDRRWLNMLPLNLETHRVQLFNISAQVSHGGQSQVRWHIFIFPISRLCQYFNALRKKLANVPGTSIPPRNNGGPFHPVKSMTYCGLWINRLAPDVKPE